MILLLPPLFLYESARISNNSSLPFLSKESAWSIRQVPLRESTVSPKAATLGLAFIALKQS
jgi:hypothetical protein